MSMDTEQGMTELLEEREKCIALDEIPQDWYNKIPEWDDLGAGDRIVIEWMGDILDGIKDDGYLFQLPICGDSTDTIDFFVHIPNPDNSSGIGDAPQVFTHLISLMGNNLVRSITKF